MTSATTSPWVYRPEVDGLRAIAVIAVLLSHLDVQRMGGGYVGVDMFFVISGYIVAGDLLRRAAEGCHSARSFYKRRLRRLMPNLLAMILVVMVAGVVFFLPEDLARLPGRALASLGGVANWLFAWQSGYFLPASKWNPLLHTWTLSLELQFYLVAPALIVAGMRLGTPVLRLAVWLVAAASFAYALGSREPASPFHFYNTFGRAWEFLLGVALTLSRPPQLSVRWSAVLCAIALAALLTSFVMFDRDGAFPDARALLPTIATALLIAVLPNAGTAYRALASWPMRRVGEASYSIYIWHWPLIVFTNYLAPGLSHHWAFVPVGVIVVLIVSLTAYRWIEAPMRSPQRMQDGRFIALIGGGLAVAIAVSWPITSTRGLPSRFGREQQGIIRTKAMVSPRRDECHRSDLTKPVTLSCRFGADVPPTIAVWSDSHGVELIQNMAAGLAERGVSAELLSFSSCPPRRPANTRTECARFQQASLDHLLNSREIDTVILAGALDSPVYRADKSWAPEFTVAARTLLAAGKRLVLVYPVPEQRFHVPRALVNRARYGIDFAGSGLSRSEFLKRNQAVYATYDALGTRNVIRVRPDAFLCATKICAVERGGLPLYFDDNHLTLLGARSLAEQTLSALATGPTADVRKPGGPS